MNSNNARTSKVAGSSSLDEILKDSKIKASDIIDQMEYNSNMKYHEFEDSASYSHEYSGDGDDEDLWFREHSNFDKIIEDIINNDWDAEDAFDDWCSGHFMRGQQYEGFSNMLKSDQDRTRKYDKYLDQSEIDEGLVLSRRATAELLGLSLGESLSLAKLKKMKGKVIVAKGNMSCGAAQDGLTIASDDSDKPIEYKIHIPAGAKGAGMWLGDKRINGWGDRQREFMTNRDSVFVIGDAKTKKKKRVYDFWTGSYKTLPIQEVHIYYIGRLPHDYS